MQHTYPKKYKHFDQYPACANSRPCTDRTHVPRSSSTKPRHPSPSPPRASKPVSTTRKPQSSPVATVYSNVLASNTQSTFIPHNVLAAPFRFDFCTMASPATIANGVNTSHQTQTSCPFTTLQRPPRTRHHDQTGRRLAKSRRRDQRI